MIMELNKQGRNKNTNKTATTIKFVLSEGGMGFTSSDKIMNLRYQSRVKCIYTLQKEILITNTHGLSNYEELERKNNDSTKHCYEKIW
jgi:hypothetical protein